MNGYNWPTVNDRGSQILAFTSSASGHFHKNKLIKEIKADTLKQGAKQFLTRCAEMTGWSLQGSRKRKNGVGTKNAHQIPSHDLIETSRFPALIFAVPMGSRVSASVPTIPVGAVR